MTKTIKLEFPIPGIKGEVEIKDIEIDKIDLDPENPRIGYWTDNQVKETFTQDEIAFALREKSDAIRRLKMSIEVSGGIIEDIWVCKKNNRYLVIDGNTRLEIYRDLSKKYPHVNKWKKIRCKVLPGKIDDKIKNFIRLIAHLRGVNDWEVYERARILYILWNVKGYTQEELESYTKLNVTQIKRLIGAYKDMTEQFLPKFGFQADALSKFSYFVEYENPKIKQAMKEANLTTKDFCEWVGTGQIKRAQDVRDLRDVFEDKDSKEMLIKRGYQYAIQQLSTKRPGFSSKLFDHVEQVLDGLKTMSRADEEEIKDDDTSSKKILLKELLSELKKFFDER